MDVHDPDYEKRPGKVGPATCRSPGFGCRAGLFLFYDVHHRVGTDRTGVMGKRNTFFFSALHDCDFQLYAGLVIC